MSDLIMKAGQTLKPGQKLSSDKGYLILQQEGYSNLALYNSANQMLWGANLYLGPVFKLDKLSMQEDGNLVVYAWGPGNPTYRAIWASGTDSNPGAYMSVNWDIGYIQINDKDGKMIWKSKTDQEIKDDPWKAEIKAQEGKKKAVLYPGATMSLGEKMVTQKGTVQFIEWEGRLQILDVKGQLKWQSSPGVFAPSLLSMGTDGNLTITDLSEIVGWQTNSAYGFKGSYFVVNWDTYQPVILQEDGHIAWDEAIGKLLSDADAEKGSIQDKANAEIKSIQDTADTKKKNVQDTADGEVAMVEKKTNAAVAEKRQQVIKID